MNVNYIQNLSKPMKTILLFITLFTCCTAHAQFEKWDWINYGYDTSLNIYNLPTGISVCTDAVKNVYVLGVYNHLLRFDTTQFTNANDENLFLAKYDASGKLLWITKAIGHYCHGSAMSVDEAGNIYIGGNFIDTVSFGSLKLVSQIQNIKDIFIAKYDSSGDIIWAKRAGGTNDVVGYGYSDGPNGGLVLDNNGHIYIAGQLKNGLADFDTIQINTTGSLFLAKYDTAGNAIWAKKAGEGMGSNSTLSLAVDRLGNIFITGAYGTSPIYFDSITLPTPTREGVMFIAKYNNDGKVVWAKSVPCYSRGNHPRIYGISVGNSLVTDSSGNIIVAGAIQGDSIAFDNIPIISNGSIYNSFIAKYSSTGNIIWAKSMNENSSVFNYPYFISVDTRSNLYVTGSYNGAYTMNNKTITSNGGEDIYITQYNDDGALQSLTSIGGSKNDQSFGITTDNAGGVYVTGNVVDTCTFGNHTISGTNSNMFVAKLSLPAVGMKQVLKPLSSISVYPNPAASIVTIKSNEGNVTGVHIVDCMGRTLYLQNNACQRSININTSLFASGVYFLTCQSDNGETMSDKFIIQH